MAELTFPSHTSFRLPNSGKFVSIPTAKPVFTGWKEHVRPKVMNNKPALLWKGLPSVAELIVAGSLGPEWQAAWVYKPKWYAHRAQHVLACNGLEGGTWTYVDKHGGVQELKKPRYQRLSLPTHVLRIIGQIYERAGIDSGCWDVVAWNGNEIQFLECKLVAKDELKDSQLRFLEATLELGFDAQRMRVVEWTFNEAPSRR